MKPFFAAVTVAFAFTCLASDLLAQTTAKSCPISFAHLSMPYNHERGMSTPTVEVSFTNLTAKTIVRAKFGLTVLGEGGNPVPYDQNLTFKTESLPGKLATSKWNLEMEKIDINHVGETLYLISAHFADGTSWADDGNQRCREEINYGPK